VSDGEFLKMVQREIMRDLAANNPGWAKKWLAQREFCAANDLKPYGIYRMEGAALFLCDVGQKSEEGSPIDTSSIKRWSNPNNLKLGFCRHGVDGKRFFGYHLADFFLDNVVEPKWDGIERRKASRSENGTSEKSPAPNTGTAADTTPKPDRHLVSALASDLTKKK
jgi:hypothetical protein